MARPRSIEAHSAALDATVDLLIESGTEGVTWEEVASRSGVAKSTLYRHFSDRDDLILRAARSTQIEHTTPDSGSLEEDLRQIFDAYATDPGERRLNQLFPVLCDAAGRDEHFAELMAEVTEGRRRPIRTVLKLAQLRGEIAEDIDLDDVFALMIGPFTFKRLVARAPIDEGFRERVLQWSLAGLRATVAAPERSA